MSGGDTLIVGDGTYTSKIDDPPSGSAEAYTTVRAENDFGALIDGSGWANSNNHGINVGTNYVIVQGFRVQMSQSNDTNAPVNVSYGNHIKIIRVGAGYGPTSGGGAATFTIGPSTDYVLVEECYAYGGGRYQYLAFVSDHTIFRRNVGRVDYWHNAGLQCAVYCNYDGKNTVFQNNIALDTPASNCTNLSDETMLYGGWYWETKTENAQPDSTSILDGNITLNVEHGVYAAGNMDRLAGTHTISNHVIYDGISGFLTEAGAHDLASDHIARYSNFTVGSLAGHNYDGANGWAAGGTAVGHTTNTDGDYVLDNTLKNSILFNNQSYGIADYTVSDYNVFYGNAMGNAGGVLNTPAIGANSITDVNPLTNGLLYLPRIEAGSYLKTAGEAGGQVGAEIMYQKGTSGTLYGESGWNDLTSTPLWPFPNEVQIKTDLAAYAGSGASGARGFATGNSMDATPQSLTKYIWEYLGNQIPANIYDSTPPSTIITTGSPVASSTGSATIEGTATDDTAVTGVKCRIGAEPDANNGTACTGTTSWSCAVSGLASGENTVYCEAYDAAGNYDSGNTITANYTPPTATVTGVTFTGVSWQ